MKTLFDQISHWKNIGEWEAIRLVFTASTTLERYYEIVCFVNSHRHLYGHRYREAILANPGFIEQFGVYDLEYIKYAQKIMGKKLEKSPQPLTRIA